jgi:hypothetical protein
MVIMLVSAAEKNADNNISKNKMAKSTHNEISFTVNSYLSGRIDGVETGLCIVCFNE